MSRPAVNSRRTLAGLVLVAAGASAGGTALGARAFANNALAELAGLALGVVVAVILADNLAEQRRRRRWQAVASGTIAAIADRLEQLRLIVLELVLLPESEGSEVMHERSLPAALGRIATSIAEHRGEWAATAVDFQSAPSKPQHHLHRSALGDFSSSQLLLDAVRPEAQYVREMLAPRALELATDVVLVELLLKLETAERVWSEGVRLVVDDWGYPEEYAWSHASDFFSAAAALAEHLTRYSFVDAYREAIARAHLLGDGEARA